MIIPFHKYHALGNDFIVVNKKLAKITNSQFPKLTRHICDRHTGVGADGVIVYDKARSKYSMQIYNADGGAAEVSGNGLRVLAHHIHASADNSPRDLTIQTVHSVHKVHIVHATDSEVTSQVTLRAPDFAVKNIPMRVPGKFFIRKPFKTKSGELLGTAVSVGNPHIVFFVDNFEFDWRTFGREAEIDKRFPQRTNVEFAVIKSRRSVEHRIWERGAGETSASGSGSSSVVAAGIINGLLDSEVVVHEPAGKLTVRIDSLEKPILLTGPSRYIATGAYWFERNAKNSR